MAIGGGVGEAFVLLRADGTQFPKDAQAVVEGGLQPAVAAAAKLVGGIFVGHKAVEFAKEGVASLEQIDKASIVTQSRIAATGGAAGITAEHVEQLAQAGAHLVGINDTIVTSSANILLGFDKITSAGDVFDRAITSAENLSVATGQDLPSAASRLGLALQDPINAASLLRREHIVLTAVQRESIAAFTRMGDTVNAQGVVLDAIDAQIGGLGLKFGQTLPGQLAIARNSLESAHIALTQGMAPALLFTAQAEQVFGDAIVALPGPLRTVAALTLAAGSATASAIPIVSAAIQGWRALFPAVAAANAVEAEGVAVKGASAAGAVAVSAANRELAASEAEVAGATSVGVAASTAMSESDLRRIVSNEAIVFSDAEVAAALEARQLAEYQALVSNDALIAADAELVAADQAAAAAALELSVANRELAASEAAAATAGGGLVATLLPFAGIAAAVAVGAALIKSRVDEGSESVSHFAATVDASLHAAAIKSYDDLSVAIGQTVEAQKALEHGATINPLNVPGDLEADAGRAAIGKLADGYTELRRKALEYSTATGKTLDESVRVIAAQQEQAAAVNLTGAAYDAAAADLGQFSTVQQTLLAGADTLFAANQALTASVKGVDAALRGQRTAQEGLLTAQIALAKARAAGHDGDVAAKAELALETAHLGAKDTAAALVAEEAKLRAMRAGTAATAADLTTAENALTAARENQARAGQSLAELERDARINARRGIEETHAQRLAIEDAARAKRAADKAAQDEEAKLAVLKAPSAPKDVAAQEEIVEKARIANATAILGEADAQRALTEAEKVGTDQDPAVEAARRGVAAAQQAVADATGAVSTARLNEADAAVKQAVALQTADGSTKNVVQSTKNQIAALKGVEAKLSPNDPLRKNLDSYIAQLEHLVIVNALVASPPTSQQIFGKGIGTFLDAVTGNVDAARAIAGFHAASGIRTTVTRPTVGLFGEGGEPEDVLAIPHSKGGFGALGGVVNHNQFDIAVDFHGVVPTEAEAIRTANALGHGIADVLESRAVKLAAKIA